MALYLKDIEFGKEPEKGSISFNQKEIKEIAKKLNAIYKSRQLMELLLETDSDVLLAISSMFVKTD